MGIKDFLFRQALKSKMKDVPPTSVTASERGLNVSPPLSRGHTSYFLEQIMSINSGSKKPSLSVNVNP